MALAGEVEDFFDKPHDAPDEADLSFWIILAAAIGDADVAGEGHLVFVGVGFANVIGAPRDAAGEVADLRFHFPGELAVDVPLEGVCDTRRETDV